MTLAKKRKIYFSIFWIILIICFVISAAVLVVIANGYRFNRQNFRLEKTSMIVLDGFTSGVKVKIDGGAEDSTNFPIRFKMLYPGRHEVEIKKDDYQSWSKVFVISPGQAILTENIVLFYQNPAINKIDSSDRKISEVKNNFTVGQKSLAIKKDEIWFHDKLVTRFSKPVASAVYDQDTNHIFTQVGSEIRALNINDLNEFTIIKLAGEEQIPFYVSGRNLIYFQNSTIYQAKIR